MKQWKEHIKHSQLNRRKSRDLSVQKYTQVPKMSERVIEFLLTTCGFISIGITIALVLFLGKDALAFFMDPDVSVWEFFTTTVWQPSIGKLGILPLFNATMLTSFIALLFATPIGILTAIYLSEFASKPLRRTLKPILEILAGIPSVVYGFFAIIFVTPLLRRIIGADVVNIYNNLSAGIMMGVLILPVITSMVEDALYSIPNSLRDAAYALGASKFQTATQIVFPAAYSGISASIIVGLSRAIGETTIAALAAGAGANFTLNPLKSAETMTGYILRISGGDVSYNTIDYTSIFAIGLLLFFITLALNMAGQYVSNKFRVGYD